MSESEINQQGYTKFRPAAHLLHIIGDDLISDESVAIIELVKNSYDADASNVLVEFIPPVQKGYGEIAVIDNGSGMSLDTVLTNWMQPASSAKRRQTRSTRGRRLLGEKGIGRFAASRLADKLELITKVANTTKEIHALFDWTEFDSKQFLDEVTFLWEERVPIDIQPEGAIKRVWLRESLDSEKNHGTIMLLSGLRAEWDRLKMGQLRASLARLVSPFAQNINFSVILSLPTEYSDLSGLVEPPASLKHPDYAIEGDVAVDGSFKLTYKHHDQSTPVEGRHKLSSDGRESACGPFKLELRVWDLEASSLDQLALELNTTREVIRKDLSQASGISIYRDDFRVLPYGEPQNDWLRLDMRRVQNPTMRISNNQVVGYILISADRNPALQDQTNREGLKQGQALKDLTTLVLAVLAELEQRRHTARPRRDGETDQGKRQSPRGRNLFDEIDLQPLQMLVRVQYAGDQTLLQAVEAQDRLIAKRLGEVKEIFARYSRLATMGQLIDVVLHDGRTYLTLIGHAADLGRRQASKLQEKLPEVTKFTNRFEQIGEYASSLSQLFRRIEPFGGRTRKRVESAELEQLIENSINIFEADINKFGIEVIRPETHTVLWVVPGEIQQIFTNLVQNSIYWLQQVQKELRRIEYQVKQISPDEVEIFFCDTGPGVPDEFRDSIFLPYFSRKPDGTGLGLTIAGETVSDYDGHLELVSLGLGACFRFTLRQRSM